jgi:hypothetical protein
MRHSPSREQRCTYLVILENESASLDDLREFAGYLSDLLLADFEVVIVDASSPPALEANRRVLRWVARYVVARPQHRHARGGIDPIRAAMDVAACDKVIVAHARVRCSEESLDDVCALLDLHEVVEPQDYFDPLPWWGGLEAGRLLVHRGIGPLLDHASMFGFRRSAARGLRGIDSNIPGDDHVRRLASQGAEVFYAVEVFVRRLPPMLEEWIHERPAQANDDFGVPLKAAFFFTLLPLALVLGLFGGGRLAGGYAGAIAFASLALALRGRLGAARFFPWRSCLYAPLWLLERSVSIYWALFRRVSVREARGVPVSLPARTHLRSNTQ